MKTTAEHKFIWREYAAILPNGKMVRNQFYRIDDSDAAKRWRIQFNNTDIFTSACIYSEPNRNSPFIAGMFFDLDAHNNLEQARTDTLGLFQLLEDRAKVRHDCLGLFFSGSKGYHIEVSWKVFGPQPSPYILQLCKRMALKAVDAGVKSLDTGIYNQGRLWRMPNSINSKKGFYKIPLTYEELRDMDAAAIANLAQNPRGDDSFASCEFCQATADWYQEAISVLGKQPKTPAASPQMILESERGWRVPPCIKAIEEATIPDGIRHCLYTDMSRYFAFLGMHPLEILERIQKIDSRNPIPDPTSIERSVRWGYAHPGFPGCNNASLRKYCKKETCFYAELKTGKQM
ncbi:MAG: hypothetical protein ABSB11_07605 [Sedimentisphaerales bacterium]